jgi:hypothetical protein
MFLRRRAIRVVLGLVAVIASGCTPDEVPSEVPELGALSLPSVVTGRDNGLSASVGNRTLWIFNDTLMTVYGVDGFSYRSATAAWGNGASLDLHDTLDPNGAPYQLIPYTAAELASNRDGGPNERFAMWSGSVIADGPESAVIFYRYLKVHAGYLRWDVLGAGSAHITAGQVVASRDPGLLFAAPEPPLSVGGIVVDGYLYLYACEITPCQVARAPVSQATTHDAWRVWDGTGWSLDLTAGQSVLPDVPGELSVSFNPYLNQYLAVHSVPLSNEVVFNTAPAPEGPWSPAQHLFTARHAADTSKSDYAAKEHPELARDNGRTLVVGYADPWEAFGGVIRLALPTLP